MRQPLEQKKSPLQRPVAHRLGRFEHKQTAQLLDLRTPSAAERTLREVSLTASSPVQRVTNNDSKTKFVPLVSSLPNVDKKYVYFTHGTYASNWPSISKQGLDPSRVGDKDVKGAKTHEKMHSSDSRNKIKYATDPNISLKYANEPANKDNEVGIQLQVRVLHNDFLDNYNNDEDQTYWRRETGGEDHSPYLNNKKYINSVKESLPSDHKGTIWSVETNQVVPPNDVRVIGLSIPPGKTVKESAYRSDFIDDSKSEKKPSYSLLSSLKFWE